MIMRYKVYLDELENKSNELVNYSKIDIANKINEIKNSFDGISWNGKAHSTYINGFNKKITKLERLNKNMELLARYLVECHNDYDSINHDLGKKWDDFIDELKGDFDELQQK